MNILHIIQFKPLLKIIDASIFISGDYPSDDCRCQICDNIELFLLSLRRELRNYNRSDLASNMSEDLTTFLESLYAPLNFQIV